MHWELLTDHLQGVIPLWQTYGERECWAGHAAKLLDSSGVCTQQLQQRWRMAVCNGARHTASPQAHVRAVGRALYAAEPTPCLHYIGSKSCAMPHTDTRACRTAYRFL